MTQPNAQTIERTPVVVIVDDEEMVTSSLGAFLEWETDYKVETFLSPAAALEVLRDRPADIVIADFLMPEMNGLQFLAKVKDLYPDIPRILLTGYADKEHAIKAINEIGLFHYFEKPWDNEAIKLVIQNGLENKTVKSALAEKLHELDHVLLQRDALTEQNEIFHQELLLAQQVQRSMLPSFLPTTPDVVFSAEYEPALGIGGDFYDIQPLSDGRIALLVADMTGHGVQAALSTVLLKIGFAPCANTSAGPVEILNNLNAVLYQGLPKELPSSIFAAAAVAVIDTANSTVHIANAGLPQPLLLKRKKGEVERITVSGMILGIFDDTMYVSSDEAELSIDPGDFLLIYSDGLAEAVNEENELYEIGSIRATMLAHADQEGSKILKQLISSVRSYARKGHEWDDMTLLGIDFRKRDG